MKLSCGKGNRLGSVEGCLGKVHVSFRKFRGTTIVVTVDREGILSQAPLGMVSQPLCEEGSILSYS